MDRKLVLVLMGLLLASCVTMPVKTGTSDSKSPATGSAAGAHSQGANSELQRCPGSLGTLAIHEDRYAYWFPYLNRYGIQSTVPALRLFAQQSGCFVVVERGRGLSNAMEERELQAAGELRKGSNFGKGQMVSADYTMTPTLIFSEQDTSGVGGAIGGMLGGSLGAALGGSLDFSSAQSMLTLVDNRSTVQVAVAEGSSRGMDIGGMTGLFGSSGGGVLSAYTRTPEGKVIVGAMMDSYNNLVRAVRNYRPQAASGPGGHGTGGKLKVDGAQPSTPANLPAGTGNLDRATIQEMQVLLNQLGFNVGNPDGIIGKKTRNAVSTFQRVSGLPVTGELDPTTIMKLRETAGG